jgi:hypothetical protein
MQTMTQQVTPQQQNIMARQAVIRQAVDMWLPIFSRTYTATNNQGPGTIDNVPLRNVGLIKRLLIEISATVTAGATNALNLTFNGASNFLSNVTFTDLSNQTRINTTGWHLYAVATAKRRRVYGGSHPFSQFPATTGAETFGPNPAGYGTNQGPIYADNPIAVTVAGALNMYYEVPFSYTDHDLRGAIYANVTNATMNLQYTVNPQFFTTTLNSAGVYQSTDGSGTLTNFTVTVYQNFLDQLPIAQQGGPVLPLLDLSTAYLLNNTSISGVVANQDNPIPFSNFRDFMSLVLIYSDTGFNTGGFAGSGVHLINYLALQSANYTNIFKLDPRTNYLMSRLVIENDFPKPMFYFDFRHKPISTIQYGNMEMIINPNIVTTPQTAFFVGFESLALINMITQAGSLYGS